MQPITRTLARARRRLYADRLLHRLGWTLLGATLLSILLAVVTPAFAVPWPWWGYLALYGGALVLALVLAGWRAPARREVAVMIDDRLDLKDTIGTALYIGESEPDHPFKETIFADAERVASVAMLRDGFPVEATPVWRWVPVTAALLAVLLVFVGEAFDPFGLRRDKQEQLAQEQADDLAQEQIEEAIALIEDIEPPDDANPDTADLMDELEAMLSNRELTNPQFKERTDAELSGLQDKLDQAVQTQENQLNAIQTAMSRLETDERGPADRFVEAMRRADFEAARQQLDKLAEQIDNDGLNDEQKQALQQQLDQLSQQLNQMAQQQGQQSQQAASAAQQQMQNAGLTQQQAQQITQQMQQGMSQQQLQQALQNAGLNQQQAQQLAQQMQQQQQQMSQQQNTQQAANNLGQAMQQMAQAMQQGQNASPAGQQGQQQLGALSQLQNQLNQMQNAQQQLQQARQGQGQGAGGQSAQGGGVGGRQAGVGDGGNPLGAERPDPGRGSSAVADLQDGRGKVIASWQTRGPVATGEAKVQYDAAVTEAQQTAEHAVTDDRAPRRYHRAIRDYFGNLPEAPTAAGE